MGLGTRVRITRPPPGKKEWEDQKATVVTLVPKAKHPLDYTIRLDGDGNEYNIAADCLEPLSIQEEIKDGPLGYCLVNNLMYCRKHRLENCGSCGVDHRMTNYQIEITTTDNFQVVDKLLDDMARIGAPSRRAPVKKSKSKAPMANKAIFRPVVNESLLAGTRQGFDPASCDIWPRGVPTYPASLRAAAFGTATIPEFAKLPVRRVRENLVVAAHHWDGFLKEQQSRDKPMARLLFQDAAQSQVLSLDLVLPIRSLQVGQHTRVPVFVVRWARSLATSMMDAMQVLGTMERGTRMSEVKVEVDEIELMALLLQRTGERLDLSFVRGVEKHPHILSVSILTPISETAQTAFYDSIGEYCHQCGTSGVSVQKCSQFVV